MKSFKFLLVIILLSGLSCKNTSEPATSSTKNDQAISSSQKLENPLKAKIKFNEYVYNFGTLKFGDSVIHQYKFKNVGSDTLRITGMDAPCICAIPFAKDTIILPGDSSAIKVVFHTAVTGGDVEKEVWIMTNTVPSKTILRIVGIVTN